MRAVPYGSLETYDLGDLRVGRSVLEPGWRWSNSIKPISRTEWCEYHHFGLCMAGSARVTMREGAEMLIEAGQLYEIPAFHDIEVIGDEPYITINWNPSPGLGEFEGRRLRPRRRDAADDRHRGLNAAGSRAWRCSLARAAWATQHGRARPARAVPRPRGDNDRRRVRGDLRRRRAGHPRRLWRSAAPSRSSAWRFVPECTRASSSWRATTSAD